MQSGFQVLKYNCRYTGSRSATFSFDNGQGGGAKHCSRTMLAPLTSLCGQTWRRPWVQVNEMARYQVLREETSINLTTLVNRSILN